MTTTRETARHHLGRSRANHEVRRGAGDPESPLATSSHTGTPPTPGRRGRQRGYSATGSLTVGVVMTWISVQVLLPLAAMTVTAFEGGWGTFAEAITSPNAVAALAITTGIALAVALLNAVMGTLIAWVLVRDEFPGKWLINAMIDIPFALPTIVASIVLLSLYGPTSPVGLHLGGTRWGVALALAFVTLPFVVRAVQPVLMEVDRSAEEAAASLGADNRTIFRRIVLPALVPALLSGTGLAFARAVGEYGSVILIGGNVPRETQVVSQYIQQQIEIGRPEHASAVSVVLLVIAFTVLLALRAVAGRGARRTEAAR